MVSIPGLISFIVNIFIIYWVYQDAKTRGMDAGIWALIACCTGCIGCCIYLLVRNDNAPNMPNYGYSVLPQETRPNLTNSYNVNASKHVQFCPKCGNRMDPMNNTCPICAAVPKGNFCSQCGNRMVRMSDICPSCGNRN